MIRYLIVGIFFLLFIATGCNKIAPGITTTVSGTVMDDNRSLPIANATINVVEYKQSFLGGNPSYGQSWTTYTGSDGKYSIKFTTTGHGSGYQIFLTLDTNYINLSRQADLAVGKDNTVNFSATQLFTLKAHIIVKNNPYPPMYVLGANASSAWIHGTNNDTVVNLLVVPNQPNGLTFGDWFPGEVNPRYHYENFILIGFNNPYSETFTVDPSTFPKTQ
jgi:hypothetical protein